MNLHSVMTENEFCMYYNVCILLGDVYIETEGVQYGLYFTSGRYLQFNCFYRKSSHKLISFEHNGSLIRPSFFSRYHLEETTGGYDALVILGTRPDDTGIWSCTVEDRVIGNQITVYTDEVRHTGWHCFQYSHFINVCYIFNKRISRL